MKGRMERKERYRRPCLFLLLLRRSGEKASTIQITGSEEGRWCLNLKKEVEIKEGFETLSHQAFIFLWVPYLSFGGGGFLSHRPCPDISSRSSHSQSSAWMNVPPFTWTSFFREGEGSRIFPFPAGFHLHDTCWVRTNETLTKLHDSFIF